MTKQDFRKLKFLYKCEEIDLQTYLLVLDLEYDLALEYRRYRTEPNDKHICSLEIIIAIMEETIQHQDKLDPNNPIDQSFIKKYVYT